MISLQAFSAATAGIAAVHRALDRSRRKVAYHHGGPGGPCSICGSTDFRLGPGGRTGLTRHPPRCAHCQSLERHRAIRRAWLLFAPSFLARRRALQISRDLAVEPHWFGSHELSVYDGDNSLDLQAIARPDALYDIVICNHVLEHIADDRQGFRELMRVLRPDGFLQVTVPDPIRSPITDDWGYPKAQMHDHYRHYGPDVIERWASLVPGVLHHEIAIADATTGTEEFVMFWSRSAATLERISAFLRLAEEEMTVFDRRVERVWWPYHRAAMAARRQLTRGALVQHLGGPDGRVMRLWRRAWGRGEG